MRLLLVEDDDLIAKGVAEALGRAGFVVDRVCDGEEGWQCGGDEDYDAVVLDLACLASTD